MSPPRLDQRIVAFRPRVAQFDSGANNETDVVGSASTGDAAAISDPISTGIGFIR